MKNAGPALQGSSQTAAWDTHTPFHGAQCKAQLPSFLFGLLLVHFGKKA